MKQTRIFAARFLLVQQITNVGCSCVKSLWKTMEISAHKIKVEVVRIGYETR